MSGAQRRRVQLGGTTVLVLPLLGFALFLLLWIVDSSLKSLAETHTFPPTFVPRQWTLEPYVSVLGRHNFLKYMSHSFVVAVVTTVWGVLVAAWSAYGFARHHTGALGGEAERDRSTNTGAGAGDARNLVLEARRVPKHRRRVQKPRSEDRLDASQHQILLAGLETVRIEVDAAGLGQSHVNGRLALEQCLPD